MVKMSSPAQTTSLPHCSRTCNMTAATCSLKAGSGKKELLHLITYGWHSTTCCCRGSAVQVGAEKALRGITKVLQERQAHGV